MKLDTNADIIHEETITIQAPLATVWSRLSLVEQWPEWNSDVKNSVLDGDLAVGNIFRWRAGPGTITSTIRAVDPPKLLAWSGRTMGIDAVHIWHLHSDGSQTHVRTEESWRGLLPRFLKGYSAKTLQTSMQKALTELKAICEADATSAELPAAG